MLVFDPWAGCGSVMAALEPWGAMVITNDIDVRHGCHLSGDALGDVVYETAWGGRHVAAPGRVRCIVTSPWFGLLDLAIPVMLRHAAVVCVQVPHTFLADGPQPRLLWLQTLADAGRLHVVVGAGPRNPVVGRRALWLVVFRSNTVRQRLINPDLERHCATFHWVL
jgi:hypothetical protein